MVEATRAGALQGRGGLADDPAGLLGRQPAVGEHRGDRLRAVQRLLDDEGGALVTPDVEDPDQPRLVDPGRAPGGVQGR